MEAAGPPAAECVRCLPRLSYAETAFGMGVLLCYKNKISHQNTAKKITHFPKITLPKKVNIIGIDPLILLKEASITLETWVVFFFNLTALKCFTLWKQGSGCVRPRC